MTEPSPFNSLPDQVKPWHTLSIEKTLRSLKTNPRLGLTSEEVRQRLKHYGANELKETEGRKNWEIFLDQFKNIMLLMLIAVAIISGTLDTIDLLQSPQTATESIPFKDPIAIFSIVILNAILGYTQESRAEKALAALKSLSAPKVQVLRDGRRSEVDATTLVPGDIVFIEAGSQIGADARIVEAANLQVREAAITGEAEAANKYASSAGLPENTPLGDRTNMVFTGTEVVRGRAKAALTATGMNTELGKIALMLQSVTREPTPLQQRLSQLGNTLVFGSLILVSIVVVAGTLQAGNFSRLQDLLEISLSMAVAVVPEGLPAVITVTLALGTQRMVKRHALIRKLPAVETLGSVNTICSDKTGTLTQNKMVVQEVETLESSFKITGEGYNPIGDIWDSKARRTIKLEEREELQTLLMACLLCNDAILIDEQKKQLGQDRWNILGDPTEGALLVLAGKAGLTQQEIEPHLVRVWEFPFSSERKRMSVIYQVNGDCRLEIITQRVITFNTQLFVFTKGSPELILERCQFYQSGKEILPMHEEQRRQILEGNARMADRGLRVLGFAYKPLLETAAARDEESVEREMIWSGLAGMLDAPRPEVKTAVAKCRAAGIRPVMITGDQARTAGAIARQLGIAKEDERVLSGEELEKLSQSELEELVERINIYARVSPEHKLRIVRALQKSGKFVAMTGDGVNDAPALKQADIGIAMGITGTDVSKEASDMVLLDDNFATIVAATEEGRVVYSNIRRFIRYILGSNIGEVITIAAAPLIGLPGVPLTPLQILWMNLVTDGLPALALAVEPPEPDVMDRPPFSPKESIFARGLGYYIIRIGLIFSILSIALMWWAFNHSSIGTDPESWKTMVFTTLCLAQMGHALAVRSDYRLTLEVNFFSNPYLLGAVVATTVLQLMLIYVIPLQNFFDTQPLTRTQLLVCLGFSALVFIWIELEKLFIRYFK